MIALLAAAEILVGVTGYGSSPEFRELQTNDACNLWVQWEKSANLLPAHLGEDWCAWAKANRVRVMTIYGDQNGPRTKELRDFWGDLYLGNNIGEYASFDRIGGKCRCCLENALGEAALMTGYERNCDVVTMAAFAPMYMRYVAEPQEFFNGRTYSSAWPGSMIWFDGLRAFGRTSYWVQKLFANNRPDVLVPFAQDVPRSREGLYTVCGLDRAKNELVVKVVNPVGARPLTLEFAAALPPGTVRVETLANNDLFAENTLEAPTKVVPIARNVGYAGGSLLQLDLSEFSLTVIRIPLR